MTENFALNNAVMRIPAFDGRTPDLKNFLQDLRNAQQLIEPGQQASFVTAVLGRLSGPARDCCYGRTFANANELIVHLKRRFAPGKDYDYYVNNLSNVKMHQGETVSDYYDRIRILMSAAESSLKEEMTADQIRNELPLMMQPLTRRCRDIFIKGLTPAIAVAVDVSQPADLQTAYAAAVCTESRMDARIIPDTRSRIPRQIDQLYEDPYRQAGNPYVGMIENYPPPNGPWTPYGPNLRRHPGFHPNFQFYPNPYGPPPNWNYPRYER